MIKRMIVACLAMCLLAGVAMAGEDLEKNFITPPDSVRIWVYWFWLNGNITREGITADLEAMKRVGVGGVLIMEVDQGTPVGPVAFMSDQWRELFKHMVSEANRLGIEVNMNNDAGWNGSGGPWVPLDKAMQVVVTSEVQVPGGRIFEGVLPMPQAKEGYYKDIAVLAFPTPADPTNLSYRIKSLRAKGMSWDRLRRCGSIYDSSGSNVPPESVVVREKIEDLTSKMGADGKLVWVPSSPGEWTVIRFGHTFTGEKCAPAPATGEGPECDKLSKEGVEANYNGMIGKLVKDVGPLAGKTFAATHVDSWEVGAQNWTPRMREEFKRRRGYDMMPYMPVLTGRIVDSLEISERFLRDVRQTVSDLLVENYIGHLRKLANRDGLRLSMEAYSAPANDLDVADYVDEPICEFWWPNGGGFAWSVKSMSSVAHVNGRPIVGAEAFTAEESERWLAHPAIIKALGDRAFCDGVNRFIVSHYAMQPWVEDRRPGMTMGEWGLHYVRTTTWWEDSRAWHQYVARCQYILRQGAFVADVLSLQSEEPMKRFKTMELPGYDYDGIGPQAFLKNAEVKRGIVKLSSGMKYRLLVLPEDEAMTQQILDKIEDLVEDGATVLGRPPLKAPGLSNYPKCDEKVQETVKKLWGSVSPGQSGERKVGKGQVVWGKTPAEVLAAMGVKPDFTSSKPLRYIHRVVEGADVYFVANSATNAVEALVSFRVDGKQPELWRPDTGQISPAMSFVEKDGITSMWLQLDQSGSVFVIFRKPSKGLDQVVNMTRDGNPVVISECGEIAQSGEYVMTTAGGKRHSMTVKLPEPQVIDGPWNVRFDPKWGGPASATFEKLEDWSKNADPGIKYYSGSATYRKTFTIPNVDFRMPNEGKSSINSAFGIRHSIYLDLGKVAVMADVTLNGKPLGILWKPPYKVDITDAVKAGENTLEVRVVNLWVNRQIGDELLPEDSERTEYGMKKWPQWLLDGKPSPTGRFTFTSLRLWKKDEPLQESGLLGPVTIQTTAMIETK